MVTMTISHAETVLDRDVVTGRLTGSNTRIWPIQHRGSGTFSEVVRLIVFPVDTAL